MLRWVAEETVQIQNQRHSDEGSSLTNLLDAELILQILVTCVGDSEALSAFELGFDSDERSVHSNYRSNHDTSDELEEDKSEHTPTQESRTLLPTPTKQENLVPTPIQCCPKK